MGLENILLNPPQNGQYFPPPQSGAEIANNAMVNGAAEEQAKNDVVQQLQNAQMEAQASQAFQDMLRQPPVLTQQQRNIVNGLLMAKGAYEGADKAYRNAADDKTRLALQDTMNVSRDTAKSLRDTANSIGFNPSQYDSDVTYSEALQNLLNNDARALNGLIYNYQTSDDYYDQMLKKYLDAGVSRGNAIREAERQAGRYQSGRIRNLEDAFRTYGRDERGVINDNGIALLERLAEEGAGDMAGMYTALNPTPVQNWNFGNALITAANAEQNARERMLMQNDMKSAARHEDYEHQKYMKLLDDELNRNRMRMKAYLDVQTKGMNNEMARQEVYRNCLILTNGDEAEAERMTAEYMVSSGRSGGSSGGGSRDKDLKKQQDIEAKMNPIIEKVMKGEIGIDNYLEDISKITPYLQDEDDVDTLVTEIPYTRNFINEWERYVQGKGKTPMGDNLIDYYNAAKDSDVFKQYVPQDVINAMEAELANRK